MTSQLLISSARFGLAAFLGLAANACAQSIQGTAAATGQGNPDTAKTSQSQLQGSWQLVRFQGGDDTVRVPDDRAKYTVEFDEGQVSVRIDCNRGRGGWKSAGAGQIEFGPLATTRAACQPESLHDQIVKQWGFIRSFVFKDNHLFLVLMADGGTYEFEPLAVKPN